MYEKPLSLHSSFFVQAGLDSVGLLQIRIPKFVLETIRYIPNGVINVFFCRNPPLPSPVVGFSLPLLLVSSPSFPNLGGPFSSFNGILNGVLRTLLPGVFGGRCFTVWFSGLEAAAVW